MDQNKHNENTNNEPFKAIPLQQESILQSKAFLLGAVILLAVCFAVFFLLPAAVDPGKVEIELLTPSEADKPAAKAPAQSPFRDAQENRARQQAQATLSELLKLQEQLDGLNVSHWADANFQTALSTAEEGDALYATRDFDEAQARYTAAVNMLEALVVRSEEVFGEWLGRGDQALADGDSEAARDAFEFAGLIKPDNEAVSAGLARAQTLNQVLRQLQQARIAETNGDLDTALAGYRSVLKLDPREARAEEGIARILGSMSESEFNGVMSTAYRDLQQENFSAAIKGFQQALAMKPNSSQAQQGLKQAHNQAQNFTLGSLLDQAQSHESEEQWADALALYERALKLDSSVAAARVGKIRAGARAELDSELQAIIDNPSRLSESRIYSEALESLAEARGLNTNGPRISAQIEAVAQRLEDAQTPVAVQFRSDNQTDVTLYKIAHMGNFLSQELELKPGHYVAVGSRKGYRDVRKEFTVGLNEAPKTVVIECTDPV